MWDMDNCLCAANGSAKHTGLKVQPCDLQTTPQVNDRSGPAPSALAKMIDSNNLMSNIKRWSKQNAPNAAWAAAAASMAVDTMDVDTGSGSGGGAIEARFKTLEEENVKLRKEMGSISTAVTEIGTNLKAGFQQLMQGQQQGMAALLARIQGTDASVSLVGHAVADIPGTAFVMPAPTAAAVMGYGGGGGMIAAAAGADAAEGGASNEVAEAVTETALTRVDTSPVDPRLVGAPYPPATTEAPRGAKEPVGAPMAPEHSDGLDEGELPAGTVAVAETRLQRLKRMALFSAKLLAAKSASDETSETMGTMWTKTAGRRSARLTSTTETGGDDGTATDGGTTQGTVEGPPTLVATVGLIDGYDGAAPLTMPGPPKLCGNAHRCRLQANRQADGFEYCCGRCFETYAVEHSENTTATGIPPTSRRRQCIFDAGQDTLNLVGTQGWALAPSSARVGGLGGGGVGVLPATVLHPCKTLAPGTEHLPRLDCGDGVGRRGITEGLVRERRGQGGADQQAIARIPSTGAEVRGAQRVRGEGRRVLLCGGSILCDSGDFD